MTVDSISLGFDIRVDPSACGGGSIPSDQLLDPHNQNPICADASVWPRPVDIASSVQGGVLPDSMNPLYLYKTFASLQSVVDELTNFDQRGKFIAISAHPAAVSYLVQRFGPGYFEHQRETDLRSAGWQHLGFDVIDLDGVISGLKGCGYKEAAVEDLRSHFLGNLNQHGLFGNPLDAAMFAQVRGLQIRDHSPFVVVGVLARDAHRSK